MQKIVDKTFVHYLLHGDAHITTIPWISILDTKHFVLEWRPWPLYVEFVYNVDWYVRCIIVQNYKTVFNRVVQQQYFI